MTMKIRKVKTSSLIIGIVVELLFAIIIGYTGGAMGFGSLYPPLLNLASKPFVCPNGQMSYVQHKNQIGPDTYTTISLFCMDEKSGIKTELNPNTVFLYATPFFGLLFFAVSLVITYLYWYSKDGPAKNNGLLLW